MLVLRYAYLLALVVWLGGMIALRMLAAPEPGGEALRRFQLVGYACAAIMLAALVAMKMLGPRPIALGVRIAIVGLMLAVAVWSGLGPGRRVEAHGLSSTLMLVNVAGGLALLYFEARTHD